MPAPALLLLAAALAGPPPAATAAAPAVPQLDSRDVPRLLVRLAVSDPPIAEVQRAAALRAAAGPAETASWQARARWAALLPHLSASYSHAERSTRTLGLTTTAEVDLLRLTPTDEVGIRLTWSLPDLVLAEAELKAADARARAARRQEQAVERATTLYFKRREMIAGLWVAPPEEARQRVAMELAVEAITAELDFLTGGLFGSRR
jgi:outer membrane protein TolC